MVGLIRVCCYYHTCLLLLSVLHCPSDFCLFSLTVFQPTAAKQASVKNYEFCTSMHKIFSKKGGTSDCQNSIKAVAPNSTVFRF